MIEILQDGAALLEANSVHHAVYTLGVESCAIHAFLGDKASLFVHDTGQLSTNSIKNHIVKCGKLRRCISVKNSCCLGKGGQYEKDHGVETHQSMLKLHEDRRSELRRKAKISVRWDLQWIPARDMVITTTGLVTAIISNAPLPAAPGRQKRLAILNLNNLFAERNGQNIKVDLQFKGGQFTPAPYLARSYDEMLQIANQKWKLGDPDYHTALMQHRVAFDEGEVMPNETGLSQ